MALSLNGDGIGMTDIITSKIQAAAMAQVQVPVARSMALSTNVTSACTLLQTLHEIHGKDSKEYQELYDKVMDSMLKAL